MSKRIDNMEILKYFFNKPNQEFHIRELAKITKVAPTPITSYLENFKTQNLLLKRKERNLVLYRANAEDKASLSKNKQEVWTKKSRIKKL